MFEDQEQEFFKIIKLLDSFNLLDHLIIIGSWAEYLYEKGNILSEFKHSIKTEDIDFLVDNIRKPYESIDIIKVLEDKDYIVDLNYNGVPKIFNENIEIEFLAKQKGKPVNPVWVNSLKINAPTLTHLEFFSEHSILVEYKEVKVKIPSPSAYLIHKILIQNERQQDKKQKDFDAIEYLIGFIEEDTKYCDEFKEIFNELGRKQKNTIKKFSSESILLPLEL